MKLLLATYICAGFGSIAGAGGAMLLYRYHATGEPMILVEAIVWLLSVSAFGAVAVGSVYAKGVDDE